MATQIGLFEIWMKNGEKMISKIYFSTDGSKAMTEEVLAAFRSRLSVRVHQVERINMWEINRVTGGIVIRSIPVGKVSEMNNSVSAVP